MTRRNRLERELGTFIRQYARRKHPRHDPNDRGYDRDLERKIKHMAPEELDRLLRGGEDGEASGGGA